MPTLTILTFKMAPGTVFYARAAQGRAGPIRSYKYSKNIICAGWWSMHHRFDRIHAPPNSWNCDLNIRLAKGRPGQPHTVLKQHAILHSASHPVTKEFQKILSRELAVPAN